MKELIEKNINWEAIGAHPTSAYRSEITDA